MDLKKYIKKITDKTSTTTSIRISEGHLNFLKNKKINLSLLVRDILEKLMRDEGGKK